MPVPKRPRPRDASQELDGDSDAKLNKTTGRPIRHSAGRKSLPKGFVDPDQVIDHESESDFEPEKVKKEEEGKHKPWSLRRRRTSPPRALPPPEPLEDLPIRRREGSTVASTPKELSLTFHVLPGHTGPFVVKLDLGSLLSPLINTTESCSTLSDPLINETSNCVLAPPSTPSTRSASPFGVGFLDLPAELRVYIYRMVFVTEDTISLRSPSNFCRSSAFLATCHQVQDEGCRILYGENKFQLERQWRMRAPYYVNEWKEVGYKDCHRFLHTIGPRNISHLRRLNIMFEDAPSNVFVEDDHLMECLKLLAGHSQLETLQLSIQGRKMLRPTEHRFLENLSAIKADSVKMIARPEVRRLYAPYLELKRAHVHGDLDKKLIEKMERKPKIYVDTYPISTRTRRRTFFPIIDNLVLDMECPFCGRKWPTSITKACCWFTRHYLRGTPDSWWIDDDELSDWATQVSWDWEGDEDMEDVFSSSSGMY